MEADSRQVDVADVPFKLGFRPALEGIRGVLILAVMGAHIPFIVGRDYENSPFTGGFLAIDQFFVLSGFLITSLLLQDAARNSRIDIKEFYRRRALRILPVLYVFLIVHITYVLTTNFVSVEEEAKSVAFILLFSANWAYVFGFILAPGFGQLWSLGVEEQFYFVWPAVCAFFIVRYLHNRRVVIGVLLGAAAICAIWRAYLASVEPDVIKLYMRTDCRLDGLLIGAALAVAIQGGWRPGQALRIVVGSVCALALFVAALGSSPFDLIWYQGLFTVAAFLCAGVVIGALEMDVPLARVLAVPPLRFLGRITYSLFIWHMLIYTIVARAALPWTEERRSLLAVSAAMVVGTLSYYLVERPFMRLRNRPRSSPDEPLRSAGAGGDDAKSATGARSPAGPPSR